MRAKDKRDLGRGLMQVYLDLKSLTAEYERTIQTEIIHEDSDARLLRMRHAMQIAVNKLREGLDPALTEEPPQETHPC